MKVALVYDRVNKWGGAERVLLALHKIFPKADLYTSVYNKKTAKWAKKFKIKTSFLQNFPFAKSAHELYAVLMPKAFESFNFDKYDLVISVTSEAAKGIVTNGKTKHISYVLTPTRYLWSGYKVYFKNKILKLITIPVILYLRNWDKLAANRPDKLIAISTEVKRRIKKYYKRDSIIIFPPLSISTKKIIKPKEKDYFLIVSRLVFYKRIDLAIKAFNDLGYSLIIIGKGGEEAKLKKIAKDNIKFIKEISDEKLYGYYKNCKALIFPGLEDFGLTMVEAQYFGKPVIAFRGGGALDIIKEKKTGEFFNSQTKESLKKVLEKFNLRLYNNKLCRENALNFSFKNFKTNLLKII